MNSFLVRYKNDLSQVLGWHIYEHGAWIEIEEKMMAYHVGGYKYLLVYYSTEIITEKEVSVLEKLFNGVEGGEFPKPWEKWDKENNDLQWDGVETELL